MFAQELDSSGFVVFEVPGVLTKRERRRSTTRGKSDPIDARAIADTVLRESERLPRYHFSVDREAIRLRYDHRNRMVRERTALINRFRSSAIRLDMQSLPVKFYGQKRLLQLTAALRRCRARADASKARVSTPAETVSSIGSCTQWLLFRFNPKITSVACTMIASAPRARTIGRRFAVSSSDWRPSCTTVFAKRSLGSTRA